jgi:hypothetical protein
VRLKAQVPGIAEKKLLDIKNSWQEHRSIRDVMIFLQGYGISTLYTVKIVDRQAIMTHFEGSSASNIDPPSEVITFCYS